MTLALEHLFNAVKARFTYDGIQAENFFGWREPAQHRDQPLPYIAWVPGDKDQLGELGGARNPGSIPRPLGLLTELFTVYIVAHDARTIEDERAQYHVTRLLYEQWVRAVYHAGHGTFRIRSQQWVRANTERTWGATLRVVCQVDSPILDVLPDEPLVSAELAGTSATVDAVAEAAASGGTITGDITVKLKEEDDA